ncbi:MAG: SprB repeat-containing protein, partial [Saprospiraceae bacterium]
MITSFMDVSCFNGSDGSATAMASGGQAPYSYSWSNGGSGATITNLTDGVYTVTVTDNLSNTATATVVISEPEALVLNTPIINHVTCNGGNNGSITASAEGGVPPYFFQWSTGATGTTISNLTAGPYTVTVTDDNNCTKVATYTVTQPSAISISLSNLDHESCAGLNDGTITIAVTGGDNPYFAEWSNNFIGLSISDLEPGVYTVTVTDDSDCTKTASYTINAGGVVDVSLLQIQHVTCNGGSNGAISVTATGGVGPYTFEWSNGMSGSSITGLSAGTYLVTATDSQGCEVVEGYTVTQPSAININISQAGQNLCSGDANVDLTANVTGGVPGYSATWSNGVVGLENDNLAAGSYTVTVTDNSGCTKTATAVVTSPPLLTANVTTTDETFSGGNNGTATATPTGGTPAYTYLWSNGGTTATITGLPPGIYTVTVTDASGCTATGSGQVDAFGCTIDVALGPDELLCDGDIIIISATVTGAINPVTYLWSNGGTSSSIEVTNGGEYCVTVTDASNCSDADCIIITEITIPPLTCPVTNESEPGFNDGAINCDGVTGIVSFLWSNGAMTSSISGLAPGEYCVTVTDSNSCTLVQCFNVQPGNCQMVVTPTQVNVACNGDTTGSI